MTQNKDVSYLNEMVGLQFMPIKADKKPIFKGWQNTSKKYDLSNVEAVGLVCGKLSGNVEVIDFDLKYDLTGTLMKRYKEMVNGYDPHILEKLVWQKTKNGGLHGIYRCETIEGNQKLAQRDATDPERAKGDKVMVLIETRGEGGQIAIAPTTDYGLIKGTLEAIPTITITERETLLLCARNFNEHFKETVNYEVKKMTFEGKSPLDDYDNRGDCVSLLEKHGWKVVGQKGPKILLKRPGSTEAAHSGNFDRDKNWFSVFSTSTEFEAQSPYKPSAVFAVLECKGDYHEATKRLAEMGFGEKKKIEKTTAPKQKVSLGSEDFSFVATEEEMEDEMNQWRDGTFQMGLTWGIPELDKHHLLKRGTFNPVNGHDNVGKSVLLWYLCTLSALIHGWKWMIFSSENRHATVKKRMIEYYWGEPIRGMNNVKYREASKWFHAHFKVIKCLELYTYKDVLNMGSNIHAVWGLDGLLVDPYNSLIRDTNGGKINTHDYDYEAATDMKVWGKSNDIALYLNCHAITAANRQKDAHGNPAAPMKADTEGGSKWAAKADDFLTIHRLVYDKDNWRKNQIYVRKVKEVETGGKNTPNSEPVILEMIDQCRYESASGIDPIRQWREQKARTSQGEIEIPKTITPTASSFTPDRISSQDRKEMEEPVTVHPDNENDPLDGDKGYFTT